MNDGPLKQEAAGSLTVDEANAARSRIDRQATIGKRVLLEHPVHVARRAEIHDEATVGRWSFVNIDTVIFRHVAVGRFCSFGRGCQVGVARHPIEFLSTHTFQCHRANFPDDPEYTVITRRPWRFHPPTSIGNDAWVGANAVVVAGVSIGHGAVIGAGAVVNADIPPYAIAVGVPARVKRMRFDEDTVSRLLATRWWNLPLSALADVPFDRLDDALNLLERRTGGG
jgi:virginiamycin A acetyltransferase